MLTILLYFAFAVCRTMNTYTRPIKNICNT